MAKDDDKSDEDFVSAPPMMTEEGPPEVPPVFQPGYAGVLDYMTEVEIPTQYKAEFERFKPVLTRALKLANIRRNDIPHYIDYLDLIILWYRSGLPKTAREYMVRMVSELMLTGSVDGFQSKVLVTSRREQVFEGFPGAKQEKEKKGFWIFKW